MGVRMYFDDDEFEMLDEALSYTYMVLMYDKDSLGFSDEQEAAFRRVVDKIDKRRREK